jgi:hypothetical protein
MMKRASLLNPKPGLSWLPLAIIGATFVATLTGCPGGADLEHPEKYFPESTGATGGTAGTGGSSGGSAGSGGSSGSSSHVGPVVVEGCDFVTSTATCATSGCHKPGAIPVAAGLNLVADDLLVSRVKDIAPTFKDIYCGNVPCPEIPAECPEGVKLVDSANVENSWMLQKITDAKGCGVAMPPSVTFAAEDRLCVENLVKAIAALP